MVYRKLPIEVLQEPVDPAWFDKNSPQIQQLLEKLRYKNNGDRIRRTGQFLLALLESPGRINPVEKLIGSVWKDFDITESALWTEANRLRKELVGTPLEYRVLNKTISPKLDPIGERRGYYIFVPNSLFSVIAYLSYGLEYALLSKVLEREQPTFIPLKEIDELLTDTGIYGNGEIGARRDTLTYRARKTLFKAQKTLKRPLGELVSVKDERCRVIGYRYIPPEIQPTQQPVESQYSHLVVSEPSLSDATPSHQP